jgi:hypothetical protein
VATPKQIKVQCVDCGKEFKYRRLGGGTVRKFCDRCRQDRSNASAKRSQAKRVKGEASPLRRWKKVKTADGTRVCAYDECETPLSKYNHGALCSIHEATAAEEDRAAVEREAIRANLRDGRSSRRNLPEGVADLDAERNRRRHAMPSVDSANPVSGVLRITDGANILGGSTGGGNSTQ